MSKNLRNNVSRQIPVTNKNTGETLYKVAPEFKRNQKQEAQSVTREVKHEVTQEVNTLSNKANIEDSSTIKSNSTETNEQIKEKKESETLEELIAGFYSGKVKSLTSERVRKVKKFGLEGENRKALVLSVSKTDLSLEKSRDLFLSTYSLNSYHSFQIVVFDFIRDVVMSHSIMSAHTNNIWFPMTDDSEADTLKELYEKIGISNNKKTSEKSKDQKPTENDKKLATELQKARINLFYIAVFWRFVKNFISISELVRILRHTLYKIQIGKDELKNHILNSLLTAQSKEIKSIACLMQWYSDEAEYDRNAMDSIRRKAESLANELKEKDELLNLANNEILALKKDNLSLNKKLEIANENERIQAIHMRADQQLQKGRTQRILEEEIPILSDCLKALERDPPKILVAKEYVGSVLEKLSRELSELKGEKDV